MKLITETLQDNIEFVPLQESNGRKGMSIKGIFMQAEQINGNKRIYSKPILENEVNRYVKKYVNENRALGELNHPSNPTVNLDKVSHKITELNFKGNDVYGSAHLLNTPMGNIAQNLIEGGVKLGVSSRGVGSLKESSNGIKEVQKDFMLSAIDIVADPSAPNAFVDGIMEGKEWIWDNGILKEKQIAEYQKTIKSTNLRNLSEQKMKVFKDFLSKL